MALESPGLSPPMLMDGQSQPPSFVQQLVTLQLEVTKQVIADCSEQMVDLITQRVHEAIATTPFIAGPEVDTSPVMPLTPHATLPWNDPLASKVMRNSEVANFRAGISTAAIELPGTSMAAIEDSDSLLDKENHVNGKYKCLEDDELLSPASTNNYDEDLKKGQSDKDGGKLAQSKNFSENAREAVKQGKKDKLESQSKGKTGAVFADATEMKAKIRDAVNKKQYSVTDYYYETGKCQEIARSVYFEHITLGVISLNALWIAIDTDLNHSDLLLHADPPFIVAENFFCFYFTGEWLIRFLSFRNKLNGLKDFWFVFDSAMCFMMVMETWVMTLAIGLTNSTSTETPFDPAVLKLFRLMRLSRMARMARLLKAMPELMILIKGMAVAMRSVMFTLCLLTIITYIFAITIRQLTRDTDTGELYFASVPTSMFSLLMNGILPDQSAIVYDCANDASTPVGSRIINALIMMLFILLGSLTVMNMLVGVLVEVVSVVSNVEKEGLIVNFVRNRLQQLIVEEVDGDNDDKISKREFQSLLVNAKAALVLEEVGVDVVGLVDFQDHIFKDTDDISFASFMDLVLQLRGTNTATVRDIVELRKFFADQISNVASAVDKVQTQQKAIQSLPPAKSLRSVALVPPKPKAPRTAMFLGEAEELCALPMFLQRDDRLPPMPEPIPTAPAALPTSFPAPQQALPTMTIQSVPNQQPALMHLDDDTPTDGSQFHNPFMPPQGNTFSQMAAPLPGQNTLSGPTNLGGTTWAKPVRHSRKPGEPDPEGNQRKSIQTGSNGHGPEAGLQNGNSNPLEVQQALLHLVSKQVNEKASLLQ